MSRASPRRVELPEEVFEMSDDDYKITFSDFADGVKMEAQSRREPVVVTWLYILFAVFIAILVIVGIVIAIGGMFVK